MSRGLTLLWCALGLAACRREADEVFVDPARRLAEAPAPTGSEVRLAIGTMISPRETLLTYHHLAEHLSRRIGHPVRIVQKRTYGETNDLLLRGEVDFAFVCSGAYVDAHPRGVELLAVPVIGEQRTYRSLILVQADNPARTVEELRGATVAYVDPLSFTGRVYLDALVAPWTPPGGTFFGSSVFSHAHTTSIDMLVRRRVQVAAVDSLVWDEMAAREPERVPGLRVLHRSPAFASPPFVARPGLPLAIREPLREALLGMERDAEGRRVLGQLHFDRFAIIDDAAYDGLRAVRAVAARGAATQRAAP